MRLHAGHRKAPAVVAAQRLGGSHAKLMARRVGRHLPDIAADELHGIAPIAHPGAVATWGLSGATVDDGDKISGDDDPVLAFLRGAFRYVALLDDSHF